MAPPGDGEALFAVPGPTFSGTAKNLAVLRLSIHSDAARGQIHLKAEKR